MLLKQAATALGCPLRQYQLASGCGDPAHEVLPAVAGAGDACQSQAQIRLARTDQHRPSDAVFLSGVSHAVNGLTSSQFLVPPLSGVVLFGVHVLIERSRHHPIFPVVLYRRGCFAAAIISAIAADFAGAVVQFQTSNFWQLVQHFSISQVARAQLPRLVCFAVGAVPAGRLMRPARPTTQLMGGGIVSLVLGLLLFAVVRVDRRLVLSMLLVVSGLAFLAVPQVTLFVQEALQGSLGPSGAGGRDWLPSQWRHRGRMRRSSPPCAGGARARARAGG